MRSSRMRNGIVAIAATLMSLQGAQVSVGQYVPYEQTRNSSYQPSNPYAAQAAPTYQAPNAYQPQPSYQPHMAPPQYRTAMAFHNGDAEESSTLTVPPETIQSPGENPMVTVPAPMTSMPAPVAEGYPSHDCGCNTGAGNCYNYNTFTQGDGFYNTGYKSGRFLRNYGCGCGRRWFGGVYGLYMERNASPWKTLAFSTLATNGPGYYPTDTEFVLNLKDIDDNSFGGAEFRFGATLGGGGCGCGSYGGCNGCNTSCGPNYAWEVAYWGLVEDEVSATATDTVADGNRLYGMIDYRGLEYDPGTGYRPVNHYYDYGPPTADYTVGPLDEIQIRSITVRNRFSAQNVELNLLRLPVLSGGYCGTACSTSCGSCDTYGCDGGGCGIGGGMGQRMAGRLRRGGAGCCDCGGPRYSVTTLIGARYMRLDEDFLIRSDYENMTTPGTGWLSHQIDLENHLIGAQIGCNGVYHLGCSGRWALHCNSVAGIYGNHMEVWNRMNSPTGTVRYSNGTNETFDLRYEDDELAFIGELRVGGSYQYGCNWRFYGGYRLLGLSGVALAFDQITPALITPTQSAYVDSDGSVILHGLQAGVECTY